MEMSTENARRSGAESVTNAELVMSQLAGNTDIVKLMALGVPESCQNAFVSNLNIFYRCCIYFELKKRNSYPEIALHKLFQIYEV